jgi:hypothetical protein
MSAPVLLADLRCDRCGSDRVVLLAPGAEELRDIFLLKRDVPVRCLCLDCWPPAEASHQRGFDKV